MTPEQEAAFKAEIAAVCKKHRIGMCGTCENEGIYGEITLFDLNDPSSWGWKEMLEHHLNWRY